MTQMPPMSVAVAQASALGTSARPESGCADCNKKGLAILPVVPAPVPNMLRGATAELKALDSHYVADDLAAHWYILRTLPAGYLYVMKPDLSWDCYLVDAEGLFRMLPPASAPAEPGAFKLMSQVCKRHGDNIPAQVIAVDPDKHAAVWLAFSRYRWTPAVMARYARNENGCRDKRMTKLDVMAAANGSLGAGSKAHNAVRFGAPMSAGIGKYVADYASADTCDALNKRLATPLQSRGGDTGQLVTKMAEISSDTRGKTGAIIALSDELGIAFELNTLRNAETARLGAYIAEHQRERFIGEIIMGFEKAYETQGHKAQWDERFAKHYDRARLRSDRKAFDQKAKPWEQRINAMSDDLASVHESQSLKAWWHDFDADDDQSARDRQTATAACLHGAVKTRREQTLWDQWFAEDPADPYATLWGAVTALDHDLGQFLVGKKLPDTGKIGSVFDVGKNIRDAANDFRERLAKRESEEALAIVGLAMSSQLNRLKIVNPDLYRVAGARVLIASAARTTVTATPVAISVTQTQYNLMLAEAAFGPPQATAKRLLDVERTSGKRVYAVSSNGVEVLASRSTTERAKVIELWLPEELAKDMPKLPAGAATHALPPPGTNAFAGLMKFTKSLPGTLAWVGLTFQALNLTSGVQEFAADAKSQEADAYVGLVSGTLGVGGAMGEIAAGAMGKMGARFAITTVAKVAFAGGVLAGVAGVAEGLQALIKFGQAVKAEDSDTAGFYFGGGVAFLASGAAGVLGALAVASTAGALTGTFSALASAGATAAVVPVWGWIVAGVLFMSVGVYMVWQAIKSTDTPLEVWLRGCVYGRGATRFTPKQEMDKLSDITYAMTIEVDWQDDPWEWSNRSFLDDYDSVHFTISLPGASLESVIDCKIVLDGKAGRKEVLHETIRPQQINGRLTDPRNVTRFVSASVSGGARPPAFVWSVPPRINGDGTAYRGVLNVDDAQYDRVELHFQYWPNSTQMPNFVLPSVLDQRTMIVKD